MKAVFWIGMVVLILGIVSLVVPIPRNEREGFKVGDMSVGVPLRDGVVSKSGQAYALFSVKSEF